MSNYQALYLIIFRSREAASEWSRGKELHAPAPQLPTSDQTEDDAIIPQGACGAFVSALEDEFMCKIILN